MTKIFTKEPFHGNLASPSRNFIPDIKNSNHGNSGNKPITQKRVVRSKFKTDIKSFNPIRPTSNSRLDMASPIAIRTKLEKVQCELIRFQNFTSSRYEIKQILKLHFPDGDFLK